MATPDRLLPPGWIETTIASIGKVRLGRQRSPQRQTGSFPTPYLRAGNITEEGVDLSDVKQMNFTPDERAVYALSAGDVLLAEASGSANQVGRPAIWRGELPLCCFQNTVIRLRPHAAIPEYALLVFRHYMATGVFADVARGVGIQHLGGSRFAHLPFPLPPLGEQQRIVEEAARRAVELRSASESLSAALARTHEQDSEVLAAAVAGRLTKASESSSARPSVQMLPSVSVPADWGVMRVDEAGEVLLGRQRTPSVHSGRHMRPYLRVANVLEDRIDVSDIKQMNFTPQEYAVYALQAGDILLNEGQSPELVGRPAIYRGEVPGACFQKTLLRFRASSEVDPEFALTVFRHYLRSGEFTRIARWSTNIAHLSRIRFAAMPFPMPPLAEQRAIAREARRLLDESLDRRNTITHSIERIANVRTEVVAAAISGELVPHEEADEDAADLLARLGPPPSDQLVIDGHQAKEHSVAKHQEPKANREVTTLAQVLRNSGPMPIPELCRQAGFDLNDTGEIERFYLALRRELGISIEPVGAIEENQILRAAPHAS